MVCNEPMNFAVGEEKLIRGRIVPQNQAEIVVINSANYVLKNESGEIVSGGACEIEKDCVQVLLKTEQSGFFELQITARVGRETIIQTAQIFVGG